MSYRAKLSVFVVSAMVAALPLPVRGAAKGPISLDLGTYQSEPNSTMEAVTWFDSALNELSQDNVFVSFQEVDENKIVSLKEGRIDIAVVPYGAVFQDNLFLLPFLFDDFGASPSVACCEHSHAVMDELATASFPQASNNDVVALALFDGSPRIIATSSGIISDPGQLSGFRLATTSQEDNVFFGGMGPTTLVRSVDEIYAMIDSGAADAISITLDVYHGREMYRLVPHLTYTYHTRVPSVLVMSRKTWESIGGQLGEECQMAIRSIARLSALVQWASREREVNEIFNDLHYKVQNYEEIDQDEFRSVALELWPSEAGGYSIDRVRDVGSYESKISELHEIDVDEQLESWKNLSDKEQEEQGFYPRSCSRR